MHTNTLRLKHKHVSQRGDLIGDHYTFDPGGQWVPSALCDSLQLQLVHIRWISVASLLVDQQTRLSSIRIYTETCGMTVGWEVIDGDAGEIESWPIFMLDTCTRFALSLFMKEQSWFDFIEAKSCDSQYALYGGAWRYQSLAYMMVTCGRQGSRRHAITC